MDFPTAWALARQTPTDAHNPRCSYRRTNGGLLCDCRVINDQADAEVTDEPADAQLGAMVRAYARNVTSGITCAHTSVRLDGAWVVVSVVRSPSRGHSRSHPAVTVGEG